MPTFRVRSVAPKQTQWADIVAEDDVDAAQSWHDKHGWLPHDGYDVVLRRDDGPDVSFVKVEVEGFGVMVSRVYRTGLRRRGGVKIGEPMTVERVAKLIAYDGDPSYLLAHDWEGEGKTWT